MSKPLVTWILILADERYSLRLSFLGGFAIETTVQSLPDRKLLGELMLLDWFLVRVGEMLESDLFWSVGETNPYSIFSRSVYNKFFLAFSAAIQSR